jgi:zinc protease
VNLRALLFLFAASLASIASAADLAIPPLKFSHRTLPNGLEFYAVEDHAAPTAAVVVGYHVGSKDDPPQRSGFAHLFEHMMFKGTKNMAPETLDRLTEDVGGANNAFTQDDLTVYHEVIPSNHLERLIWAEAERMASLIIDEANFLSEREVVKSEYLQTVEAAPYGRFEEEVQKRSFAAHPYKRTTIGSIPDLNAALLDDVRKFHTTFYRPDNATLVVVGDFDPKQLDGWIDRYFGPVPRPDASIPRVNVPEPPRIRTQHITTNDAAVPLPAFAITYLAPDLRSEDALALELGVEILAGGESSRMHRTLVYEKEFAQSVEGSAGLREDLGLLVFKVVVASRHSPQEVEGACEKLLDDMITAPPAEAEMAKAKNRLLTARLHERETNEGKALALANAALLLHDAARVDTDLARLQAVTAGQVHDALKKILTEPNRLVIEVLPIPPKAAKKEGKR